MGYFSSYIPTVRTLFEDFDAELSKYLVDANIDEVWLSHDNWNGGIDTYNIVLTVPTDLFKSLRRKNVIEQAEAELDKCYADAMRGEGESLQIASVVIRPTTADVSQLGNNYNDRMWKPGYFRLFISHLSGEQEIEAALFSLDALCAIVVPGFEKSNWCDQEVGIALGRKKMVFSIKKGKDPYGFFGKYQALPSQRNANDMAQDLTKAICVNEFTRGEYFTKLVNLVLNASSDTIALKFIQVLSEAEHLDKQYVGLLHDNFTSNQTIMKENVLAAVNPLFRKYGLSELQIVIPSNNQDDDMDLPF